MNPIGVIAGKQGGTLGKLLDPAQYAGSKSENPVIKYLDPMNVIREEPMEEWETPAVGPDTGQYSDKPKPVVFAEKGQSLLATPFGIVGGVPVKKRQLLVGD